MSAPILLDEIRYRYYTRSEIDNLAGQHLAADIDGTPSSHTLLDKVRIVGMFHQLQANFGGGLDPLHDRFLSQSAGSLTESLTRMPGCDRYEKCVFLHGCDILGGCPSDPVIIEKIPNRLLCWFVLDCPRGDDGIFDDRSTGGISTPHNGGSTSSSINTGSTAFNDRIKNCNNGGGPGDPPSDGGEATPDEAFCLAITRLTNECLPGGPGSGLSAPSLRHILEIIDAVEGCDQGSGDNLTQAATYVCDQAGGHETDQIIKDYAEYAAMAGVSDAVCLEDYLKVLAYINNTNSDLSVAGLLAQFDIKRCLQLASGCESPECINPLPCIHKQITLRTLNLLSNVIEQAEFDRISGGPPIVRWNYYGLGGLLQYVDGKWIYEIEGAVPGTFTYYEYVNNSWVEYTPPSFPPDMHFLEALLDATIDIGHQTLDVAGLVPVIGELADGVNAIWYYAEGDMVNGHLAALSMVPVLGYGASAAKIARNTLKYTAGVFTSPGGLKFAERTYHGIGNQNALEHVFRHAMDIPNRPGKHGVFNEIDDIVGLMDEAYAKILTNSADVVEASGNSYIVKMGRDIGWEGGSAGSKEALSHLQIVVDNAGNVITSFPVKWPK